MKREKISKEKLLKGSYLFQGSRLEGKVKNRGIKAKKKVPKNLKKKS